VIYDTIELRDGATLFVRWGNWPLMIFALSVLAAVWSSRLTGTNRDADVRSQPAG